MENHFEWKNGKEIKGGGLTKAQRQALEEGEIISVLMYGLGSMKHRHWHWHDMRHDDTTILEKLGNDTVEIPQLIYIHTHTHTHTLLGIFYFYFKFWK